MVMVGSRLLIPNERASCTAFGWCMTGRQGVLTTLAAYRTCADASQRLLQSERPHSTAASPATRYFAHRCHLRLHMCLNRVVRRIIRRGWVG